MVPPDKTILPKAGPGRGNARGETSGARFPPGTRSDLKSASFVAHWILCLWVPMAKVPWRKTASSVGSVARSSCRYCKRQRANSLW